jgi:hypothetical protein
MTEVTVEVLTEVSEQDATQLGLLLTSLSESYNGQPVPLERLETIIDSPDKDQFVARLHSRIVGAATLNIIDGLISRKAWLEDFIVSPDPDLRGSGIGYAIWKELGSWCKSKELDLSFTSRDSRNDAHDFYQRQGAVILPTCVFRAGF